MNNVSYRVVIPARLQSTRLPRKPLADIAGKSMIQRVYERARESSATEVWIATDDREIEAVARLFGANVMMTSATHTSGTDRLEEVASVLGWGDEDIVVNVQGDEPLIPPQVIDQVARNLASRAQMSAATLAEPLADLARVFDANVVKVVRDQQGRALYFSRAPIPYDRDQFANFSRLTRLPRTDLWLRHIGIYAYRVGCLKRYVAAATADLQAVESLEQLRLLVMGESMHVDLACAEVPAGVDTPADLARVRALY